MYNLNRIFAELCVKNDFIKVKKHIDSGFNVAFNNGYILRLLAANDNLEMVKFLIDNYKFSNKAICYAMRICATFGYFEIFKFLDTHRPGSLFNIKNIIYVAGRHNYHNIVFYVRPMLSKRYKCHKCIIKSTCLELCKECKT